MDKSNISSWRYKVEMTYLNTKKNISINIKNECVKSVIIDHNYENNCMPIMYVNLSLDRALIDDMIININKNLFTIAIYKYDELLDHELEIECFRKKFTYFLPDDVNKNSSIDYSTVSIDQNFGDTYRTISLGLLCIEHINRNKKSIEINAKKTSKYHLVKYITSDFDNILIEPFDYNETFDNIIIPPQDSINKALRFLNNQKVFYRTPYRYYQDFNCTYIISSGGFGVARKGEKITTVIFDIKDILDDEANDVGMITNKTRGNYRIVVNAVDTAVYDNSLSNKSKNMVRGITSTGNTVKQLSRNATYSDDKISNIRLNNDNEHMIENIKSKNDSSNIYINISKNDLDATILSINKRYSINNIDAYADYNGDYILCRKRELYLREDETFKLNTILNFRMYEE